MKSHFAFVAVVVTFLSVAGAVQAKSVVTSVNANADLRAVTQVNINGTSAQASTSAAVRANATATAAKNNRATTTGNATSAAARNEQASSTGQRMSETHRSVVATFVQSLLAVADREGGIGVEVQAIAQSQANSSTTTVIAMQKVEARGDIRTFFFGSDYKNLGVIRSEMATTTANITHLKALLAEVSADADRIELEAQIETLEAEQLEVNNYVIAHQDTFSLFGWFTKLFAQ